MIIVRLCAWVHVSVCASLCMCFYWCFFILDLLRNSATVRILGTESTMNSCFVHKIVLS